LAFSVERQSRWRWYVVWPLQLMVRRDEDRISRFGPFLTRWGASRWGRRIFE
jgi:hypothetical protein